MFSIECAKVNKNWCFSFGFSGRFFVLSSINDTSVFSIRFFGPFFRTKLFLQLLQKSTRESHIMTFTKVVPHIFFYRTEKKNFEISLDFVNEMQEFCFRFVFSDERKNGQTKKYN